MGRRPHYTPLNVFLNGRLVGRLRRAASGAIDFQYDPGWLAWDYALPVSLSLPLREDRYSGEPVQAVFDNLLPDNDVIRRRVAERVGAAGTDAYSLLSAVGRDCIGALQFLPYDLAPGPVGGTEGEPLTDEQVAAMLADLARAPLGLGEDQAFRISLAGAQEKTALLFTGGQWKRPHGTAATTHILKPAIGRLPNGADLSHSVENEYLCLKLTEAFGLPSARAEILTFAGTPTLSVERFDRRWTRDGRLLRLPQEDLCQALSIPPTRKYEAEGGPGAVAILRQLNASDEPQTDQLLFLRALVVFWLLGATDGHAKNFSLSLGVGGRFRMAPLYDVISVQPSVDAGQLRHAQFKLAMAVGTSRHYRVEAVAPRHFLQTADAAGIGAPLVHALFLRLVEGGPAAIEAVVSALPPSFPEPLVTSVTAAIRARLSILAAARIPS
jgi:serine/threonine-protein kinase HipA